jgi:2-keto-3-deoxy-6-phosphogluconate aldolase
LKVFPTAGVTEANVKDWFAAGAFGVGFVGGLFVPDDLANKRFGAVRERAARMVDAVAACAPRPVSC